MAFFAFQEFEYLLKKLVFVRPGDICAIGYFKTFLKKGVLK